jgi:hypothetical protein
MVELKHSKIFRGGITASRLTFETRSCSFCANAEGRSLDIRFELASKGGGTTAVLLQIGIDDLPMILEAIANELPECAGALSYSSSVASRIVLQQLKDARKVLADNKARAKKLSRTLENIKEVVWDNYIEVLLGDNEREADACKQFEKVVDALSRWP